MGLTIVLQEKGGKILETVEDPTNVLRGVLPGPDAEDFPYLRYVDPYGDTIFNRLQMSPFLLEWGALARRTSSAEAQAILRTVRRLAETCAEEVHCFLRFVGD
ncbi:MAG: hypothetical protein AB7I33_14845 [Gemmatimonadales bacterium]